MPPMAAENGDGDIELALRNGSAGSATGLDSARLGESPVRAAVCNGQFVLCANRR